MHIIVIDENRIFEMRLKERHTDLLIHGKHIVFIYANDEWKIKVPAEFIYQVKENIIPGNAVVLKDKDSGNKVKLYFEMSENVLYRKYPWKDSFSIGPENTNDLSYPEHIHIDIKERYVETDSQELACNGLCFHQSHYEIGDILLGKNFKAVLGPDFIMVRGPISIHQITPYQCLNTMVPLKEYHWHLQRQLPLPTVPENIELPPPITLPQMTQRNLLAMILPSILMLSSTFGMGLYTAYHSYMNGREVSEVLPMVLLPGVMLLSTIFTHPLLRLIQKYHYKKQKIHRIQSYHQKLEEIADSYLNLQRNYYWSYNQNMISTDRLFFLLKKHIMPEKTDSFLLGWIQKENKVDVLHHLNPEDNDLIQMEKDFENRLHRTIWIPYCFDGKSTILVEGEQKETFFLSILIEAGFSMEHIALTCTHEFIQKYPFILRLPGLLNDSGRDITICGNRTIQDRNTLTFSVNENQERTYVISIGETNRTDLLFQIGKESTIYDSHSHLMIPFQPNQFHGIFPMTCFPMSNFRKRVDPSFLDLYDQPTARNLEIEERWRNNARQQSRCAVVGVDDYGEKIAIDLSEKSEGPHGLIAGTTGSGKSEFILTMLLSLMVNYSPEQLQIAFIDFKGGSASHIFEVHGRRLPHMVGCLSNLDINNTERVLYALKNECIRRQRVLKDAGTKYHCSIMKLSDYQILRQKYEGLDALADLVIVVDEFAELRAQSYEMLNQLISIARIGRSLGIHLILSTQKPAGIVSDQIWANSHFKVCLKVSEKQDSMEVLHSSDAMGLKKSGEFILECDGNIQKGTCGYSGYRHLRQKISLQTIKENGMIDQDYAAYGEQDVPEILSVCKEIDSAWKGKTIHSLWCEPLHAWPEEDLIQHHAFGIADNIYEQKQSYVCFHYDAHSHWAFLSDDPSVRERMILYCKKIFQKKFSETKLYCIDSIENRDDAVTMNQAFCRKDTAKIILIQDASRFYEREYELKIHDLLEHSQEYNLQCVFFLSQTSGMPYRDLSMMSHKICLKNENCDDMSSFLGARVKQPISSEEKGLLFQNHLLSIQLSHRKEYTDA